MDAVWIKGDANSTMELVRYLRSRGLVQGCDFEFKYEPRRWGPIVHGDGSVDMNDSHYPQDKGSYFYFKDPKWATFFRIKHVDQ